MAGCQLTGYARRVSETASRPFGVPTTFIATRWASCSGTQACPFDDGDVDKHILLAILRRPRTRSPYLH